MTYHRIAIAALIVFSLGGPALAQNPHAGASMDATDAYNACMVGPTADYAQREGSPKRLASKIAQLCIAEEAAMATAYIAEFFPNLAADEADEMAARYVDQITSAMREVVALDIIRLRIEAQNAQ